MKLTDTQSNRVQILRGLAILAVVLIHNTPGGLIQVFVRPFLNFAVAMFLFLSGLLSRRESWSPKKAAAEGAGSLYPLDAHLCHPE